MFLNLLQTIWNSWIRDVAVLALVIFASRSAIADWNHVPTGSMKPTIVEGDVIFVNRLAYDLKFPFTTWQLAKWDDPARGDIVILYSPSDGRRLVKRVIGLPGDAIALNKHRLYINGVGVDYSELDGTKISDITTADRQAHRFVYEALPHKHHAIMTKPLSPASTFGPVLVPKDQYLVLGDHRDNSADSRYFGFVDRTQILGRSNRVLVSWDKNRYYLPRTGRFLTALE